MIVKKNNDNNPNVQYGKRFKADMSISLSQLYKEIEKAQAYVDQLTEKLVVFGNSDGSPGQDSEFEWDSVEKKLTLPHIDCEDIVLDSGATIDEFSTDDTLAGDSDTAVPTEQAVKGYVDTEAAKSVLADGTRELTGDWDAGSHKITAEQLESDIATGTPPLIVASETMVDNLNADQWDGNEFADYLDQDMKTTATPTLADLTLSNTTASRMAGTDGSKKIVSLAPSAAITQTYSTTTQTHNNLTSATLTDSTSGSKDNTVSQVTDNSETTNNTTINDNFAELTEEVNALRVDVENVKQLLNFIIDHGQTINLYG